MRIDLDTISMEELHTSGGRLLVVAALQSLPYHEYLLTNWWKWRRNEAMRASRWQCQWKPCHERAHDVHHLNYDNIGMEPPEDLLTLCRPHHINFHKNWKLVVHIEGRKQFDR